MAHMSGDFLSAQGKNIPEAQRQSRKTRVATTICGPVRHGQCDRRSRGTQTSAKPSSANDFARGQSARFSGIRGEQVRGICRSARAER
jgi:hypothetical protein